MIKLLKKDIILFFHDQKSYLLTFLIPIILITLFAYAYGAIGTESSSTSSYDMLLTDHDNTILSKQYITVLDSIEALNIELSTYEETSKQVRDGSYAGALIIHNGFLDSLMTGRPVNIEMLYDRDKSFEASMMRSIVLNVLYSFINTINEQSSNLVPGQSFGKSINMQDTPVLRMTSIVGEQGNQNLGLIQAVAGTAILMLLFSVAAIGTSILEEKENGTISRLLFSPISLKAILYSKMLFALIVSLMQLTVMFVFAAIFLDLDLSINIKALILMIFATAFAVSSLGIFLAAIAKSRQQAQSLSTLIILVMSAIGGSMIPLFIMPDIMNKIAVMSVNYWSIQGFYDIFWRELPISEILPEIMVLTVSGLVLSFFSVKLFSKSVFRIV